MRGQDARKVCSFAQNIVNASFFYKDQEKFNDEQAMKWAGDEEPQPAPQKKWIPGSFKVLTSQVKTMSSDPDLKTKKPGKQHL